MGTPQELQQQFGLTAEMTYADGSWHGAYDIGCPTGTPLNSPVSGKVSRADDDVPTGQSGGYGSPSNMILLNANSKKHGQVTFQFQHLAQGLAVKVGDTVTAGQLLGQTDNTGYSTGSHLHFMAWKGWSSNPNDVYSDHSLLIFPPTDALDDAGGVVGTGKPKPTDVKIIGDSLQVGANEYLTGPSTPGGITVTKALAQNGLTMQEAWQFLTELYPDPEKSPPLSSQAFLIAVGTNDMGTPEADFKKLVTEIQTLLKDRLIIWGNLHTPASEHLNASLGSPVVDLATSAKKNLAGDGIHLTPEGYKARADLEVAAIDAEATKFSAAANAASTTGTTAKTAPDFTPAGAKDPGAAYAKLVDLKKIRETTKWNPPLPLSVDNEETKKRENIKGWIAADPMPLTGYNLTAAGQIPTSDIPDTSNATTPSATSGATSTSSDGTAPQGDGLFSTNPVSAIASAGTALAAASSSDPKKFSDAKDLASSASPTLTATSGVANSVASAVTNPGVGAGPDNLGFDRREYGFRFLMNPTTYGEGYTNTPGTDVVEFARAYASSKVPMLGKQTGASMTLELFLTRVDDMRILRRDNWKDYYPDTASMTEDDRKAILTRGTMNDIEYLFRLSNGKQFETWWSAGMKTSDWGVFLPAPVIVSIGDSKGSQRIRGIMGGLSITHDLFAPGMVPIITRISLNIERMVDYQSQGVDWEGDATDSALVTKPASSSSVSGDVNINSSKSDQNKTALDYGLNAIGLGDSALAKGVEAVGGWLSSVFGG